MIRLLAISDPKNAWHIKSSADQLEKKTKRFRSDWGGSCVWTMPARDETVGEPRAVFDYLTQKRESRGRDNGIRLFRTANGGRGTARWDARIDRTSFKQQLLFAR